MKRVMYQVYEYTCDLCGHTWQPERWFDNPNGGSCDIVKDGVNGKDYATFEHLCMACRAEIQWVIQQVIRNRRKCERAEK